MKHHFCPVTKVENPKNEQFLSTVRLKKRFLKSKFCLRSYERLLVYFWCREKMFYLIGNIKVYSNTDWNFVDWKLFPTDYSLLSIKIFGFWLKFQPAKVMPTFFLLVIIIKTRKPNAHLNQKVEIIHSFFYKNNFIRISRLKIGKN